MISEKYLRSPYCMFELAAAWDRGEFQGRVFPIVLPDAKSIYGDKEQIELVKFWKQQHLDFKEMVGSIDDDEAKEGFLQKLRDRQFVYQRVSGAIAGITGMVGIAPEELLESRFAEIIEQVEARIGKQPAKKEKQEDEGAALDKRETEGGSAEDTVLEKKAPREATIRQLAPASSRTGYKDDLRRVKEYFSPEYEYLEVEECDEAENILVKLNTELGSDTKLDITKKRTYKESLRRIIKMIHRYREHFDEDIKQEAFYELEWLEKQLIKNWLF